MGGIVIGKDARLAILERTVDRLSKAVDTLVSRQFLLSNASQVFLAKTTTSGTYPSAGANTFEIQFLDYSFTATAGTQTLTSTNRASTPTHVAYSPAGFIDENTIVFAVRISNSAGKPQYVIIEPGASGVTGYKDVIFTLASTALTTSSSTNTATIYSQFGIGSTSPNTGAGAISVNNMPVSGGGYLFEGDVGDYGIAIWDNGNAYQIIQMECP